MHETGKVEYLTPCTIHTHFLKASGQCHQYKKISYNYFFESLVNIDFHTKSALIFSTFRWAMAVIRCSPICKYFITCTLYLWQSVPLQQFSPTWLGVCFKILYIIYCLCKTRTGLLALLDGSESVRCTWAVWARGVPGQLVTWSFKLERCLALLEIATNQQQQHPWMSRRDKVKLPMQPAPIFRDCLNGG